MNATLALISSNNNNLSLSPEELVINLIYPSWDYPEKRSYEFKQIFFCI